MGVALTKSGASTAQSTQTYDCLERSLRILPEHLPSEVFGQCQFVVLFILTILKESYYELERRQIMLKQHRKVCFIIR